MRTPKVFTKADDPWRVKLRLLPLVSRPPTGVRRDKKQAYRCWASSCLENCCTVSQTKRPLLPKMVSRQRKDHVRPIANWALLSQQILISNSTPLAGWREFRSKRSCGPTAAADSWACRAPESKHPQVKNYVHTHTHTHQACVCVLIFALFKKKKKGTKTNP